MDDEKARERIRAVMGCNTNRLLVVLTPSPSQAAVSRPEDAGWLFPDCRRIDHGMIDQQREESSHSQDVRVRGRMRYAAWDLAVSFVWK